MSIVLDFYLDDWKKVIPASNSIPHILLLRLFEKFDEENYFCFHAGTAFNEAGDIVTNGGRVLGITAKGADLKSARAEAYKATEWIDFANKYMRNDIGKAIL